jgi:hypothetical protein
MATKNRIASIELSSIASSTVSGTYQAINAGGLPNACHSINIVNDSTQDVTVSFDGSTDHNYLKTGNTLNVATPDGFINGIRKGETVWVKGSSGSGNLYLSGKYMAD